VIKPNHLTTAKTLIEKSREHRRFKTFYLSEKKTGMFDGAL